MATAVATRPAPTFGFRRHLALAAFWFGGNFHWGPILPILLPFQVARLVGHDNQGSGLGIILGSGAVIAMVLPPLVGAYSDRLTTKWGRRRPIMIAGTAFNVVGLIGLMLAPNYALLLVAYLVVQVFNNTAGAAFNALVPDVVPPAEFGRQSGFLGAMVQLGTVGGLAAYIVLSMLGRPLLTYAVIAAVIVVTIIPTIWAAGNEGTTAVPGAGGRAARPFKAAARDFLAPLWSGDFGWAVFTRLLVTAGIWSLLPFLQYFFRDVGGMLHADTFTSYWELLVLLAATPLGIAGGWLSDRLGRKIFVYLSGALMTAVLVTFVVTYTHDVTWLYALGALYGLGYGLYYAVDWAIACDTLPDRDAAAKDMGLFHVAFTLPQVLLPSALGFVLDAFNRQSANSGYRVVFSTAIVFSLLGTLLVSRIKSIR